MSDWKSLRLGDFAEVVGGGTPSTADSENFGGDIPWVTPKDLSLHRKKFIGEGARYITEKGLASSSAKILPIGSVLLSSRAPIGLTAITTKPLATNQGCRSLVVDSKLAEAAFVYYLISASTDYLHQHANGTTFMEISGTALKNLEFVIPSLFEQRRIAEVLGAADDAIENAKGLVTSLELAIELEGTVAIQTSTESSKVLPMLATITNGYSYSSSELVEESEVALVNLKNFGRKGGFRLDGLKPFLGSPKPLQFLETGDLMVAKTDLTQDAEVIGRCLRMPSLPQYGRYAASLDIAVARTKGQMPQSALHAILAQPEFREHCLGYTNGTTVLHMSKRALETYLIPDLSDEVITGLATRVEILASQQDRTLVKLYHFEILRDFLLPRLVSGELRVEEAVEMLEEVL